MSYKDDEEIVGADIKEDEVDILISPDGLDDPLEDEILDDDLFVDEDEDSLEFAGLDGSTY